MVVVGALVVVHDELDVPFSELRVKQGDLVEEGRAHLDTAPDHQVGQVDG